MNIQYLPHKKINFRKWDDCIRNSINGNLYAFSWYLNIVSEGWDALILGDYETVMPITHQKKLGVSYILQPFFSQQLGVFSTQRITSEIVSEFIITIPSKFRYIQINLNKYNTISDLDFEQKKNHNFELDLILPYEQIIRKYSENTRRNISKAQQQKLKVLSNSCPVDEFIKLIKNNVGIKVENIPPEKYSNIQRIVSLSLQNQWGEMLSVNNNKNNLLAAVFFLFSHKKAYYLYAASTEEGKEKRAMFLLIDEFIRKYSEKNLILDFEGSNMKGLARFYQGFGSIDCEYITIKQNRLPFPLRLFKK